MSSKHLSFFLALLLSVALTELKAQQTRLDSVVELLNRSRQNSMDKVRMLDLMSRELRNRSPEKSLIYAQQALLIAQRMNFRVGMNDAIFNIAQSYWAMDNFPKALEYLQKSLRFYRNSEDQEKEARVMSFLAGIHYEFGDYDLAFEYYIGALKIYRKIEQTYGEALSLCNIGKTYTVTRNFREAYKHFGMAKQLIDTLKNPRLMGIIQLNRGNTLQSEKKYPQSLLSFQDAQQYFLASEDQINEAEALYGEGKVFSATGRTNDALASFLKSLQFNEEAQNREGISQCFLGIAELYLQTGNPTRSIDYLNKSITLARKLHNKRLIRDNMQNFSLAFEKLNVPSQALKYHKLFKAYNDSIYSENKLAVISGLQTRYELERREQERVNDKEKIDFLSKKYIEQGMVLINKDYDIRRQNILIGASVGIIILTVLLVIIFYRAKTQSNRANKQLKAQNEEIMRQKVEIENQKEQLSRAFEKISDSIRYAETIQKAILPSEYKLLDCLGSHFLISQAKDMVSGDFYWVSRLEKLTLMAVVDCTGHGVPGGFTTMIGHTLLNEIVNQEKISDPALILSYLNRGIVSVIENKYEDVAIGMEACLATFQDDPVDPDYVLLHFAGAKRPLYTIIPNGKVGPITEINELRGDRVSIGLNNSDTSEYTTHGIRIPKGSLIYLTSDGFTDQANPQKKRFGSNRFKDVLKKIARMKVEEQKSYLERTLRNYQKDASQRDDITILGVKV